jgi:CRISPR-associated protein Cmr4
METKLMFVHALSPLHAGTGQGVGTIDLPVAREKATNIPFLPGSSLKGVIRDACDDNDLRTEIFGPDTNNADAHSSQITFTDARLLLFPTRSLRGVFAWATSPLLLSRFVRDAGNIQGISLNTNIPSPENEGVCFINSNDCVLRMEQNGNPLVVLEDLPLTAVPSDDVSTWAGWLGEALFPNDAEWQKMFGERLCIVPDDLMGFLLETATEVTARIRLQDDKKTVERGALWYEESLPTETVLASLVAAVPIKTATDVIFKTVKDLTMKPMQMGGNATIGRGLCRIILA